MTQYIITNGNGMYLCRDDLKKLCATDRPEKALKFDTSGRAFNVLNCSFPKKKRVGWNVVPVAAEEKTETKHAFKAKQKVTVQFCNGSCKYRSEVSVSPDEDAGLNWNDIAEQVESLYKKLIDYREKIHNDLKKVNHELSDCYHACEFFRYNAANGYKLYSMMRERRIKRRYLKNEFLKVSAILNMPYQNIADGGVKQAFKGIDEQTYEPRVLEELFKI